MRAKSEAGHSLMRFINEIGVPTEILTDGAKELNQSEWGKTCRKFGIKQPIAEPHSPWQNPSELYGGIVKRKVRHLMKKKLTPLKLWDYCWEFASEVLTMTASGHHLLDGLTPYEKIYGSAPNISEYVQYE